MDRLYVLQKEYLEDRYNIDGDVILKLLKLYGTRNLDKFIVADEYTEKPGYKTVMVGNLEFTGACNTKPIEVPVSLRKDKYLNRQYDIQLGKDITDTKNKFIKDADTLKSWNNLLYLGLDRDVSEFIEPDKHYVVSEILDIMCEYRVFVYRDQIQSIQCYINNKLIFPDLDLIKEMIEDYKSDSKRPKAYTIDVCIDTRKKTSVLEVHNFVSCGLYGFQDEILLNMLADGYDWVTSRKTR